MTNHDEANRCQRGPSVRARTCRGRWTMPGGRCGVSGPRCAQDQIATECVRERGPGGPARCATCGPFMRESMDAFATSLASHVRTRLRTMAGDTFSISRYTSDCVAEALYERLLSDTDAVLRRILDFAALRHAYEGSSTVTLDDVRVALSSPASARW